MSRLTGLWLFRSLSLIKIFAQELLDLHGGIIHHGSSCEKSRHRVTVASESQGWKE